MKLGMIGLGKMGANMTKRLLAHQRFDVGEPAGDTARRLDYGAIRRPDRADSQAAG